MIAGCWDLRPLSLAAHGSEARPPYLYSGDGNASFHEFTHQVLAYAPMPRTDWAEMFPNDARRSPYTIYSRVIEVRSKPTE
jgi:hypothetical protein